MYNILWFSKSWCKFEKIKMSVYFVIIFVFISVATTMPPPPYDCKTKVRLGLYCYYTENCSLNVSILASYN